MSDLVLTTYDWVPEWPRGYVRDLRVRWALEEVGLPYRVASTPFKERGPQHLAHQPFAQVPWLTDGDVTLFESGAILLHLGLNRDVLIPKDPVSRAEVMNWLFAALNSVEMASLPWWLVSMDPGNKGTPAEATFDDFMKTHRLARLEPVLESREWLTGAFSIADIVMADVLRLIDRMGGLADFPEARAYILRATSRPAFAKAHADQMAHFAAAD